MQLIRCTRKLQKAIGITSNEISDTEPSPSILGSWHANLVELGGDVCIVFGNDKTFINFFVDARTAETVIGLKSSFTLGLSCHLSELETPEETKKQMLDDYNEIGFANSNSRKIIGTMNQFAL